MSSQLRLSSEIEQLQVHITKRLSQDKPDQKPKTGSRSFQCVGRVLSILGGQEGCIGSVWRFSVKKTKIQTVQAGISLILLAVRRSLLGDWDLLKSLLDWE